MAIVNTNFYSPIFGTGLANLRKTENEISSSVEKLSSGLRITNSADDPSGKVIANKFMAQIGGMRVASNNAQDAISMLQTASSALDETSGILSRMRDLTLKTMNTATLTTTDINTMQTEFDSLRSEVTRKATATTFNSVVLLDGTLAAGKDTQIGPDNGAANTLTITIQTMLASSIANATADLVGVQLFSDGTNSAAGHAGSALAAVSLSLDYMGTVQSALGVQQIKLNSIVNDLSSQEVNTSSALSRITDADMASEVSHFAKLQIVAQAGVAILAQGDNITQRIVNILDKL